MAHQLVDARADYEVGPPTSNLRTFGRRRMEEVPGTTDPRWMRIRSGILEPKHRKAMGERIWLYLYLHNQADYETGIVSTYQHTEASTALDIPLRTIKDQMAKLEAAGYIIVTRSKWHCKVEICRYKVSEMGAAPPRETPAPGPEPSQEVQPIALVPRQEVQPIALVDGAETAKKCNTASQEVQSAVARTDSRLQESIPSANAEGTQATPHRRQRAAPTPAQKQPTPRTEQPQYRVFLALCTAAGSGPADMEGHKGTACANAAKALKLLTPRYADEGHADPAGDAEADLCAMVAWKVLDYRRENRRKRGLPPGMIWMAYQDMPAWREAGSPGRVQTTEATPRRNGPGRIYDPTLDPGHRAAMVAMEAKWAVSPCNPANQHR